MYFLKTFFILFGFWLVLSGMFDAFHITLGLISSALVAAWSGDLLFRNRSPSRSGWHALITTLRFFRWHHLRFFLWLQWQIIVANVQMLRLSFHPRIHEIIDPQLFLYEVRLKSDFAKFMLANSITLTPGTVTVRISGNKFLVHAITPEAAGDFLVRGPDHLPEEGAQMERQVREIFEEEA